MSPKRVATIEWCVVVILIGFVVCLQLQHNHLHRTAGIAGKFFWSVNYHDDYFRKAHAEREAWEKRNKTSKKLKVRPAGAPDFARGWSGR